MASRRDRRKVDNANRPQGTVSDWASALTAALANEGDEIPEGYRTLDEIEQDTGGKFGRWTLKRRLPLMEQRGTAIKGYFRRADSAGRIIKVPHWKLS